MTSLPNEVTQDAYAANGESLLLSQPESQLSQHVINENDVIVEKLHIHYGLKEKVMMDSSAFICIYDLPPLLQLILY